MKFSSILQKLSVSFLVIVMLLAGCGDDTQQMNNTQSEKATNSEKLFTLLPSAQTGVTFNNILLDDPLGDNNLISFDYYYNGAGVAIGDFNNDDKPDLFFTGNETENQLYLNRGNFKFENISKKAGININKKWATGATVVDINQDGFLDIYVSQAGPSPKAEERQNCLYINNGNDTFSEKAKEYGLNDGNLSMQATFFDYDADGDLDCYILNESKYNDVSLAVISEDLKNPGRLEAASGKLFRNDGATFTNVTKEAGMLKMGYGLGVAVSDINQDGLLDLYVTNDYFVPDFLYINNGDGTFSEQLKEFTRQISFYGMGVDIADINNDGLMDIAVVDMAAEDHLRDKTLMPSMDVGLFRFYVNQKKFQYQYMFNSMQLNNGNGTFSNVANMAGVARSDWSWSVLLADFDNDGHKDYFVSNGFRRYGRDNDFRKKMADMRQANGGSIPLNKRKELYDAMPTIKLENALYQNQADLTFSRINYAWGMSEPSYSSGAAYADLDGDGDLDMVVNNTDMEAFVYRNNTRERHGGNYFQVLLNPQSQGIPIAGTKVTIEYGDKKQYLEWMNTRGYMSAMDEVLHFGMGDATKIDEVKVVWPNGKIQILKDISVNQKLVINQKDANQPLVTDNSSENKFIRKVSVKYKE